MANRMLWVLASLLVGVSATYAQPATLRPVPMIGEAPAKALTPGPSRAQDRLSTKRPLPLDGRFAAPTTGAGVVIAILDGMPAESEEFEGRVLERRDFVQEPGSCLPGDPHGSTVASIAGGRDYGIAPGASLLFYCVLRSSDNLISYTAWAAAMDAVISFRQANPMTRVIVNNSSGTMSDPYEDPYIARAKAAGIILISSAGNDSGDACRNWPSMETFAVGASDDLDNQVDRPAWFSNQGPCVDLFAPGRFVESAFGIDSGTSVSSPLVAGVLAVQAARFPWLSAEGLMQAVLADASVGLIDGLEPTSPNRLAFITGEPPKGCIADVDTMCLGDGGRFRVEVTWKDYAGNVGTGKVAPAGTTDSGLFYFFTPTNWELLIKVLDGCALSGHYWVFFAATVLLAVLWT